MQNRSLCIIKTIYATTNLKLTKIATKSSKNDEKTHTINVQRGWNRKTHFFKIKPTNL